ncbi:MAG TPA: ribosome silencing factor [Acidimicrobiales bacterium]|jgi:ribosome-associated protein|nr:ribosome silencing factor [Acidimicrobiales bacterium]
MSPPTPIHEHDEVRDWVGVAARAADAKKGADIVVLDVGDVLSITGWFVITSAPNDRLVRTLAEEIEQQVAGAGGPRPLRVEGLDDLRWVLMDYGDFVVHVFLEEARRYYDLERLWRDVPTLDWAAGT